MCPIISRTLKSIKTPNDRDSKVSIQGHKMATIQILLRFKNVKEHMKVKKNKLYI